MSWWQLTQLDANGNPKFHCYHYEVNIGYSYHVFPAYLSVNLTEVAWGGHPWENKTTTAEYLQNPGNNVVYFKKTMFPIYGHWTAG